MARRDERGITYEDGITNHPSARSMNINHQRMVLLFQALPSQPHPCLRRRRRGRSGIDGLRLSPVTGRGRMKRSVILGVSQPIAELVQL